MQPVNYAGNGAAVQSAVVSKISTGLDTLVMGSSSNLSLDFSHVTYRISGASGTVWSSQIGFGTATTAPNPPSLTIPSARDALWFATRHTQIASTYSASPANYIGPVHFTTAVPNISVAQRSINTATEDPGVWGQTSAITGTFTVAVDPAPLQTMTIRTASATWAAKTASMWSGSAWVDKPILQWNGTEWKRVT